MNLKIQLALLVSLYSLSSYAQAQTCIAEMAQTTPTAYFTVHGDGTVTDKTTGLMWKACIEGQTWSAGSCNGSETTHNWQQALQIPGSLNVAGGYAAHSDWRLPNINEYVSIAELSCFDPSINLSIFPAITPNYVFRMYWAASPISYRSNSAHVFRFGLGSAHLDVRSNANHVRLVRGEQ